MVFLQTVKRSSVFSVVGRALHARQRRLLLPVLLPSLDDPASFYSLVHQLAILRTPDRSQILQNRNVEVAVAVDDQSEWMLQAGADVSLRFRDQNKKWALAVEDGVCNHWQRNRMRGPKRPVGMT